MAGCGKSVPDADAQPSVPVAESAASQSEKAKILVVHSYYTDYEWVTAVSRGIRMTIAPNQHQLEFIYMDTKRRTDEAWKRQKAAEVLDAIKKWQPDVVITVDDNAQEYVGRHLAGDTSPSVVFCGVNKEPEHYGYPAENVTGVLERLHYSQSLDLLKKLVPKAEKIVMISDDSPTSQGVYKQIEQIECQSGIQLYDLVMPKTFGQWKNVILEYGREVDAIAIYTYHTVLKSTFETESMKPADVIQWTVENSPVPVVGFLPFTDGSFCGVLESGTEQGALAGKLALDIIAGTPAGQLPIVTGTKGQAMVNLETARKYGIEIDKQLLESMDLVIGQ